METDYGSTRRDREDDLIRVAQQVSALLSSRSELNELDMLVAPDVVVHKADSRRLREELFGIEALRGWLRSYIANYNFSHIPICQAADVDQSAAYNFTIDKDVTPKRGAFPEQTEQDLQPSSSAGIWRYVVNEDGRVRDIWFLRQLTRDEFPKKPHPPELHEPQFAEVRVEDYLGLQLPYDPARIARMHAVAEAYERMWQVEDASGVEDVLAEDFRLRNLMLGQEVRSRQGFAEMISKSSKHWESRGEVCDIAVTRDTNKAFLWFEAKGVQHGAPGAHTHAVSLYGMELLVFDEACRLIKEVLAFRLPLASERRHLHTER